MGAISAFVDAFNKALGRKPAIDAKELARSSGGTLGSTPEGYAGKFDPLRPAPDPDTGEGPGDLDLSVSSGDPEEGGEVGVDSKTKHETVKNTISDV